MLVNETKEDMEGNMDILDIIWENEEIEEEDGD